VVKAQKDDPHTDIFTGLPFADPDAEPVVYTMEQIQQMIPTLPPAKQAELRATIAQMQQAGMSDDRIAALVSKSLAGDYSHSTLDANLTKLGVADPDKPSQISLYPVDFEAKDAIADIIASYNKTKDEADQITYTDYVGLMMSSITTIINAISYILIAFVAISLVVSSIMIGIITNISVLERTKEIGILRAVGASKKDVSRVFNAETLIVGFAAGMLGIGVTLALNVVANIIIRDLTNIVTIAVLPAGAGVVLVLISMLLTAVAGLIPSGLAARKDPVVALRTE
jgi:putative ABC transport system permease protein